MADVGAALLGDPATDAWDIDATVKTALTRDAYEGATWRDYNRAAELALNAGATTASNYLRVKEALPTILQR